MLCEQCGINFIETEESYTSTSSFLDNDILANYDDEKLKQDEFQFKGKRVFRGLYNTAKGFLINADCNGAANIIRKVMTQLEVSLAKVDRGILTVPKRYLLDDLSKKYRERVQG